MRGARHTTSGALGGGAATVPSARARDLLVVGLGGSLALGLALALALAVPNPNPALALALAVGALVVLALVLSPRYELTLALIALYLGLLDGPVKLYSNAGSTASAIRDVLIVAVSLGALARALARSERVRLPPLSGWVLAFVALVLVQALNPGTHGLLKVAGGFRQQLEWVPFFFFGHLLMRSRERLRRLFVLLGAIALVNGLVSTYQTRLSPGQLAGWGPGYAAYVSGGKGLGEGGKGLTGRTFSSEGEARVRPPALGSDEGFGGSVGTLSLAGVLALMVTGALRRRWVAPVLCAGAALAVATSLQRTQVLGAVAAMLTFALFSLRAHPRLTRPLGALVAVAAIAAVLGMALTALEGGGVFSRYASIAPGNAGSTATSYRERTLLQIPTDLANAPFGVGLATAGAAAGFGQPVHAEIAGQSASAESQYNLIALELGLPGLLLWIALSAKVIALGARRLRRIADVELRVELAAVLATLFAFALIGLAGPTTAAPPFGPFFWFAAGIVAYWFAGPGSALAGPRRSLVGPGGGAQPIELAGA